MTVTTSSIPQKIVVDGVTLTQLDRVIAIKNTSSLIDTISDTNEYSTTSTSLTLLKTISIPLYIDNDKHFYYAILKFDYKSSGAEGTWKVIQYRGEALNNIEELVNSIRINKTTYTTARMLITLLGYGKSGVSLKIYCKTANSSYPVYIRNIYCYIYKTIMSS